MIPLVTHQRVWKWLCVLPVEKDARNCKKYNAIFTLFVLMAHLAVIITSIAFVNRYVWIDLKDSLHALLHLTAFMGMTYVLVMAIILRTKIVNIFEELTEIYHKRKHNFKISLIMNIMIFF